jgi:hypothetical protein
MANLLRTAKPGNYWSQVKLCGYNIFVEFQDAATFFIVNPLPQPAVADELLNNVAVDDTVNERNYKLLHYIDLKTDSAPTEQSAVKDLAVHLLTVLGYVPRTGMACTRMDIPLTICGQDCSAQPYVCIVDAGDVLLFIQDAYCIPVL